MLTINWGQYTGLRIEHNNIDDLPYTGISVGYGWTLEPNAMHDNLIAYNKISNVMNKLADGAGIYTLSMQPGTKIIGNHIYSIHKTKWADNAPPVVGIYLDECTSGTEKKPFVVKENFIEAQQRYNFHIIGKVAIDNDYFYSRQEKSKSVKDMAGLSPDYKDLEAILLLVTRK